MAASQLELAFGFTFEDLYDREGLSRLDAAFIEYLKAEATELHNQLVTVRADHAALDDKALSNLLIDIGPYLEAFLARLFGIEEEVHALASRHHGLTPLYACKRLFVQRRAPKAYKPNEAEGFDGRVLEQELEQLFDSPFSEEVYARHVMQWLDSPDAHAPELDLAAKYACWALHSGAGQAHVRQGVVFKKPRKLDPYHLVPVETEIRDGVTMLKLPEDHLRQREGFALTDEGADLKQALDEANYCIYCHNQGKDSCSKGLKDKEGNFKQSVHNVTLAGCPLEEKISEMNSLKAQGVPLGALAVATVDNPMCAGTGHRICNDCMKSCIYQKQDPVDIPQMETRTLKDVLELPWGFEIYSLLTRWNPLNVERPLPKPETGYKVLVAGLGPAGYTLAHHLMNDGHTVVAVDGLKIEPLPEEISGVTPEGKPVPFKPIRDWNELRENLDERVLAGFGGVAEYGITVRWDKNFLKVIRLLLERRRQFAMFGGVRFGSTLTVDQAWELGFDHIALCMGAGKPTTLSIPNGMARGVRTASDFLMALQLTGAAKDDSIANLTLRLPVVVIGGGLTAVDTATESLAYYPVQVEKFLTRYEALVALKGEEEVCRLWTHEEREVADEFIRHAQLIRDERSKAAAEGREADIIGLMKSWGGVTLAYRRKLTDAPSYRLNHEEVEKAFEEGFFFLEEVTPEAVVVDETNHAKALRVKGTGGELTELPARTVLIAAGTSPNTVLQREDPAHFELDGKYFRMVDETGEPVAPEWVSKPSAPHVLLSVDEPGGRAISFFGDLHPDYAGNVVKAMGSAKQGYPVVTKTLAKQPPAKAADNERFLTEMNALFRARVERVERLTPNIVEVVVKAPLAAGNFQPGQFYRLQNFECFALRSQGINAHSPNPESRIPNPRTTLAMEGLALTGAWVDKEEGLLSTIVLEMGGSSDLCAYLKPGEPVVLMGPTGTPTETPGGETVLLAGGGLGNAVLFSIGKAFRENGSKVVYFAGYKKAQDRYKVEEIEKAADVVIWACDEKQTFEPGRPQDKSYHGNIVQAMVAYQTGELGEAPIPLTEVDRIIAIGSDRMMAAVTEARHTVLKEWIKPGHLAIGSINSPMQCMMKEICAQCLQKHIDPETGEERLVYSCFNQDQPLDCVSFSHLNERLKQNSLQEKLTAQWIDHCLKTLQLRQAA